MDNPQLCAIGWRPFFDEQVSEQVRDGALIVRVWAHFGTEILLQGEGEAFRVPVQSAEAAGDIAVGDWLVLSAAEQRAIQRLERQTFLYRIAAGEDVSRQVIAANVDTIFIVSSCNEDFNLSRIERYLTLVLQSGAVPVIVLTKADLCPDTSADNSADVEGFRHQAAQLHDGLIVETLDARQPDQAASLNKWCGPGQTVALFGSSGVGKSTLANALGAGDLATGAIRDQDGKGRHTTTARSLHRLPGSAILMDNPGVRELQLSDCDEGVTDLFEDVILIESSCRFNNCSHQGDAGCAVAAALESGDLDKRRYASYLKINEEQARNARTLAQRRDRERKTTKKYKAIIEKKSRRRKGKR